MSAINFPCETCFFMLQPGDFFRYGGMTFMKVAHDCPWMKYLRPDVEEDIFPNAVRFTPDGEASLSLLDEEEMVVPVKATISISF